MYKTAVFDNIHLTIICTAFVHINPTQPSKPIFIYDIHIATAHFYKSILRDQCINIKLFTTN